MLGCEEGARAPEAGGDLIEDQQQTVLVAELAHQRDALGCVESHPSGALHDRLHDHRRQLA